MDNYQIQQWPFDDYLNDIVLPRGSRVLSVSSTQNDLQIWSLTPVSGKVVNAPRVRCKIFATGATMDKTDWDEWTFAGTIPLLGGLVWHIWWRHEP